MTIYTKVITPVSIITNSISSKNVIGHHLPMSGETAYRYAVPMYIIAWILLFVNQPNIAENIFSNCFERSSGLAFASIFFAWKLLHSLCILIS